ncbi:patatin-like phospholipase family protein [Salinisphaera sp. Q1T1-3]|uniref:patatin-like phospholipase family protein n=1 Tax=Salinisphaera sp. Q1T1-3 TaxID=2321229 RepID=UPI000E765614|nr:patatin-like phospholipase family protein [Salinisphaera sp. Q1T1-3]RJS92494.1 patatin-like phospholipase family protein [Salinisphaera sp. Q1T1-3]
MTDNRGDERGRLALQRMERALVRARRALPDRIADTDYAALRYALGLARMHRLCLPDGTDLTLDPQPIDSLRDWLLNHLHDALRSPAPEEEKLAVAVEAAGDVRVRARLARDALLASHAAVCDAETIDREAAQRALVVVAGGGGGAGYVYAGAFACLDEAGLIPDYIVGNSMGAVLGLMRAQRRHADLAEHVDFAAALTNRDLFSAARRRAEFGMPGLLHLHLRALHQRLSVGEFRRPVRLDELEIPLDVVVAGLKRQPYERVMTDQLRSEGRATRWLPLRLRVAARLTRLLTFFRSDMVEPIVLGRDALTRSIHAVDAAGFSAAVPSILQYEPSPRAGVTREIFAELMSRDELAAIVDGGVADNVPTRAAWRGVANGRAGLRNGYYLAFDCFVPRIDPKNAWLWPITQTVQMQMRINRVYADTMVRFRRTLSPINLVPGRSGLELAVNWGYQTMESQLPEVRAMLETVSVEAAGVRS